MRCITRMRLWWSIDWEPPKSVSEVALQESSWFGCCKQQTQKSVFIRYWEEDWLFSYLLLFDALCFDLIFEIEKRSWYWLSLELGVRSYGHLILLMKARGSTVVGWLINFSNVLLSDIKKGLVLVYLETWSSKLPWMISGCRKSPNL